MPPFVVLHDSVLTHIASTGPSEIAGLALVPGIGERKIADFGATLLSCVREFCEGAGLEQDVFWRPTSLVPLRVPPGRIDLYTQAFTEGQSLEKIARDHGRSINTIGQYLEAWIERDRPDSIAAWVDSKTFDKVQEVAGLNCTGTLRQIYGSLEFQIPYEQISAVLAVLLVRSTTT